jgi:hypothetical protein
MTLKSETYLGISFLDLRATLTGSLGVADLLGVANFSIVVARVWCQGREVESGIAVVNTACTGA